MSITYAELWPEVLFARQPYWQEIITDQYITTTGVRWQTQLIVNSAPTDGQTLIVNVGFNVTFTFRNSPSNDYEIAIPAAGPSFDTELRDNMIAAFRRIWQILENWDTPFNTSLLTFNIRAKKPGFVWAILFSGTTISSGNFDFVTNNVAGVDEVRREDFRLYFDLWSYANAGSLYANIVTGLSFIPDNNQRARFRYERLAHDILAPDELPYTASTIGTAFPAVKSIRRIHFSATEVAEGLSTPPPEPSGWNPPAYVRSADFIAILAGRSRDRLLSLLLLATNRYRLLYTNLLETWAYSNTRLWLACFLFKPGASYTGALHYTAYYSDGSTASGNTAITGSGSADSFFYLPFTTAQIAAALPATTAVALKYEVWIVHTDPGATVTNKMTVHMEQDTRAVWHRLYIHNSLNGWDFVPCNGYLKMMVDGEVATALVDETKNDFYSPTNVFPGTSRVYDSSHVISYEFNTGYRSRAYCETLALELRECRRATFLAGQPGFPIDLVIQHDSVKEVYDEQNQLYSLTFTAEQSWEDRAA